MWTPEDTDFAKKHAKEYALHQGLSEEDAVAYAEYYVWYHTEHGYSFEHALPHSHDCMFYAFRAQVVED